MEQEESRESALRPQQKPRKGTAPSLRQCLLTGSGLGSTFGWLLAAGRYAASLCLAWSSGRRRKPRLGRVKSWLPEHGKAESARRDSCVSQTGTADNDIPDLPAIVLDSLDHRTVAQCLSRSVLFVQPARLVSAVPTRTRLSSPASSRSVSFFLPLSLPAHTLLVIATRLGRDQRNSFRLTDDPRPPRSCQLCQRLRLFGRPLTVPFTRARLHLCPRTARLPATPPSFASFGSSCPTQPTTPPDLSTLSCPALPRRPIRRTPNSRAS